MKTEKNVYILTAWLVAIAACSDDTSSPDVGLDASADASVADSGPPPAMCNAVAPASCQRASDCGPDGSSPSNCAFCSPYNQKLCVRECLSPPLFSSGELHNLAFEVGNLAIESFAGFAFGGRTAGGLDLACSDVYGAAFDPKNPCLNILDVRSLAAIGRPGQIYTMSFSGFASGERTLFVIYGFAQPGAVGTPVGVSCTEVAPAAPATPPRGRDIGGDRLKPIQ